LGDHIVLFGTIENLEDKLNKLYTFYKKVWVPSGINAYQTLDLRFDHQVVALKKGLAPIKYAPGAMPFIQLQNTIDTVEMKDTTMKKTVTTPIITTNLDTIKKTINQPDKKVEIAPISKAKPILSSKAQPKKAVKTNNKENIKKLNNKSNNKSLNQVKKSAKAEMPKKASSNNN
jgi:cell division protein FtsQ